MSMRNACIGLLHEDKEIIVVYQSALCFSDMKGMLVLRSEQTLGGKDKFFSINKCTQKHKSHSSYENRGPPESTGDASPPVGSE